MLKALLIKTNKSVTLIIKQKNKDKIKKIRLRLRIKVKIVTFYKILKFKNRKLKCSEQIIMSVTSILKLKRSRISS
jgi:hypothetical protein